MMPWNEGQVTTTIAETGAPWPVNASNPDFLHNPAVVQQSTETVHTVCEGDRPHWSSWDVTAMAQEWAAGSLGNNGVILWATNEEVNGRDLRFAARETTNATIRPVLQVAYGAGTGLDADCSMFDDWSNVCTPDTTQPSTAVPTSPTDPDLPTMTTAAVSESTTAIVTVVASVTLDPSSDSSASDEDNTTGSLTLIIVVVIVVLLCFVLVAAVAWRAKQKPSPESPESPSRGAAAFENPA